MNICVIIGCIVLALIVLYQSHEIGNLTAGKELHEKIIDAQTLNIKELFEKYNLGLDTINKLADATVELTYYITYNSSNTALLKDILSHVLQGTEPKNITTTNDIDRLREMWIDAEFIRKLKKEKSKI